MMMITMEDWVTIKNLRTKNPEIGIRMIARGIVDTDDIILVRCNPQDVAAEVGLAKATYKKMVQI